MSHLSVGGTSSSRQNGGDEGQIHKRMGRNAENWDRCFQGRRSRRSEVQSHATPRKPYFGVCVVATLRHAHQGREFGASQVLKVRSTHGNGRRGGSHLFNETIASEQRNARQEHMHQRAIPVEEKHRIAYTGRPCVTGAPRHDSGKVEKRTRAASICPVEDLEDRTCSPIRLRRSTGLWVFRSYFLHAALQGPRARRREAYRPEVLKSNTRAAAWNTDEETTARCAGEILGPDTHEERPSRRYEAYVCIAEICQHDSQKVEHIGVTAVERKRRAARRRASRLRAPKITSLLNSGGPFVRSLCFRHSPQRISQRLMAPRSCFSLCVSP